MAMGMLVASSLLCQHLCLLPAMCILLMSMFPCCSSLFLTLEQEVAGLVPWLQLGRSPEHTPLVLQKILEDLPHFSSKEQKTGLGCSRVLACAICAKNSGISGLRAKNKALT